MSFADRVIRMRRASRVSELSDEDKSGDPQLVATAHIDIVAPREVQEVGKPRASSLKKACMRMHVIGTITNVHIPRYGSFKHKVTFGIGDACHYWAQNTKFLFANRRVGWWRCTACNKVLYFGKPPKAKCSKCGARKEAIVYHEHFMNIKGVTGHPDLFLEVKKDLRIAEIKTMSAIQFVKLAAPLVEHEWQLLTYMDGSRVDKALPVKIDHTVGYLIYLSKGWHTDMLPIKMYPVVYEPTIVKQIKAKIQSYTDGLKGYPSVLPAPLKACLPDFTSYTARSCKCKQMCIDLL